MAKRIRVRAVPRSEPDVRLYVLALIELSRQLQAEQEAANGTGDRIGEPGGVDASEVGDD